MELFMIAIVLTLTGVEGQTWVYVGDSATVQCPLRLASCTGIQWHRLSGSAAPMTITDPSRQKYELTNSCGLVIKGVTRQDALYYQCKISGSSGGVYLFVFEPQPSCTTDPDDTTEDVAEDDKIKYKCDATIYGIGKPEVKWFDKYGKAAEGDEDDNSQGSRIIGTLSTDAKGPKVETLQCYAIFNSTSAVVPVKVCETKEFAILYPVNKVSIWPLLYVGPGETLTCSANGNPKATLYWVVKEDDAEEWEFFEEGETAVAELKNGTSSATYKCVAINVIRGKPHDEESDEVKLTKHGKAIRIAIIVSVCVGLVVLAIIGGFIWKNYSG